MPFKKYTQEEIKALNTSPKFKSLIRPYYSLDVLEVLQSELPGLGKSYKDSALFLQNLQNGKIRAGNGERFPADWSLNDFACYLHEKEEKLAEKQKYIKSGEPVPEELEAPAFLLYDEKNKQFKKIEVNHFYDKTAGRGTVESVGTIELDTQKVPAEDTKQREESVKLNQRIDGEMTADIADEINKLYFDLRKRDSVFSSNSPEYTKFYQGLKTLRSKIVDEVGKPKQISAEELNSIFKDPENNVFSMAQDYLTAKSKKSGMLSDRQADRMSMCHRFMSIQKAVENAPKAYEEGKIPNCRAEILSATMAHKAILGTLKAAGPVAVKRELGNSSLYNAHFETLHTHIQKNVTSDKIAKCAAGSPADAAEFFAPGQIKKDTSKSTPLTNEDYLEAKEAMTHKTKDEYNALSIAEYIMVRTHKMLDEMNTHDSFIHSNEQKQFRVAIENLHDNLVGAGKRVNFNSATMTDALADVSKATEAYRNRHLGDNAADADMNAVHRLGFAEEIHLCSQFLENNTDNLKDPKELFGKIAAHQQKMRELDRKYDKMHKEMMEDELNFSPTYSQKTIDAEKDFTVAFNDLVSVYNYNTVLENKVEEMKKDMSEGDEALFGAAATHNKTVTQVKLSIMANAMPDPTKVEEATEDELADEGYAFLNQ